MGATGMTGTPRERLEKYLEDHGVPLDANQAVDALDVIMQWVGAEVDKDDVSSEDDVSMLCEARDLALQVLPEKEVI